MLRLNSRARWEDFNMELWCLKYQTLYSSVFALSILRMIYYLSVLRSAKCFLTLITVFLRVSRLATFFIERLWQRILQKWLVHFYRTPANGLPRDSKNLLKNPRIILTICNIEHRKHRTYRNLVKKKLL